MAINDKLQRARRKLEDAKEDLSRITKQHYPVGCTVKVILNRAIVTGVVEAHGQEWSEPSHVYIRNVDTQKLRRFSSTYDDAIVIQRGGR
jgi:hypothetical protein